MEFHKYKVTIERVDIKAVTKRSWEKLADSGNKEDRGPVYGYAEYPSREYETTTLLTQEISAENGIDMKAVIKAINGI